MPVLFYDLGRITDNQRIGSVYDLSVLVRLIEPLDRHQFISFVYGQRKGAVHAVAKDEWAQRIRRESDCLAIVCPGHDNIGAAAIQPDEFICTDMQINQECSTSPLHAYRYPTVPYKTVLLNLAA